MRLLYNKFFFIPFSCSQTFISPEFSIKENKSENVTVSFNSVLPAAQAMDPVADSPRWIGSNLLSSPK